MRLALVPPSKLTSEQLPLYEDMKAGISAKYGAFTTMRDDGTILGPWSAWLHTPKLGTAIWSVTKAMTLFRHLPEVSRQIVILVVGTRFRAAYEIYAHSAVASTRNHSWVTRWLSFESRTSLASSIISSLKYDSPSKKRGY